MSGEWDEFPPPTTRYIRTRLIIGIFCTGAALGVGVTTTIFALNGSI